MHPEATEIEAMEVVALLSGTQPSIRSWASRSVLQVWARCLELALRALPLIAVAQRSQIWLGASQLFALLPRPACWLLWAHGGERPPVGPHA